MQLVLPSVDLPFEYTAFDMNPSLIMAMKIYDVTSGVASLVSTIAMAHVINGTYFGKFTPVKNKAYLINKMAYTSLSYATPDSNYSPGSETIYAKDLAPTGALDAEIISPTNLSAEVLE